MPIDAVTGYLFSYAVTILLALSLIAKVTAQEHEITIIIIQIKIFLPLLRIMFFHAFLNIYIISPLQEYFILEL